MMNMCMVGHASHQECASDLGVGIYFHEVSCLQFNVNRPLTQGYEVPKMVVSSCQLFVLVHEVTRTMNTSCKSISRSNLTGI